MQAGAAAAVAVAAWAGEQVALHDFRKCCITLTATDTLHSEKKSQARFVVLSVTSRLRLPSSLERFRFAGTSGTFHPPSWQLPRVFGHLWPPI